MMIDQEVATVSVFEIDLPAHRERYLVTHPQEILRNIRALQEKKRFISLYLDDGHVFFLSTIIRVDQDTGTILLDLPGRAEQLAPALAAEHITISCILDRVKVQFRLDGLSQVMLDGKPAMLASMPKEMLRLQRREFFRIDTPVITPLRCQLIRRREENTILLAELPLRDISGGGMCLAGPIELAEQFILGELFSECRLDIPGDAVFTINLCIREISRVETASGDWQLRLGCEFINLPGTRLSLIERYVTRLERERKSRESGIL